LARVKCTGASFICWRENHFVHRRDATDVQRAIDHGSSRTPVQLVGSLFKASYPLGWEITRVSDKWIPAR